MNNKQKTWIAAGASVVVIIALVLLIAGLRAQGGNTGSSSNSAYQTTIVQRGTLTSTVEGTGTVRSLLSADLNWQAGGQVDKVNVQIGDQIKTGDVLASLLPGSTQSSLESNLITAEQNLAQLTSPEAIANAKLAVTNAQADVINAQTALNSQQYWKNDALIQDYYAKMVIAKANLDKAQAAYDGANVGQYINNSNEAILYQTLYNAQQAYNNAKFNYTLYSQAPTQRQVDQAQANLDLANATLKNAQIYLAALTGGDVPADATGADLLKLNQAKLAVQSAQDSLDAIQITAPFDGTVTQSNAVPQAVVSSGTQAFRVDDLSNLVIDVQVVEVDINHVKVGQPVAITFDAIPDKNYNGKVIKTDLAGTVTQNGVNFTVTVQLTDADAQVRPGMAANATVITNKVENALLVPSTSIFSDANGQQYVYRVQNGGTVKVPVTVGAVSDSTTQITSDTLHEGDTIVLSFASSSSTTGGNGFGFRLGGGGAGVGNTQQVVNAKPQPVATP
ncbi:MAG TPA: efflux RND transporter periplasmic adaptor subunit [Anaerolineales bacterium]|nr:efflux RND transporter periplasmic adaptor subunit [Anaerolineales bacterium]